MAGGVDDSSTRANGAGSSDPHAAWLRAGKARQAAKAVDEDAAARDRAEKDRAYKAQYREQNRERIRAYKADYDAKNRDEIRRKNREYMRARSQRMRELKERRERDRERVRRWTTAHPEQKRASIQRWRESHPEKTAEYSRRYYERNREAVLERSRRRRDAEPEKVAAAARDWQQRNRAHLSEWQRAHRAENRDAYERTLRSNREAKMLQRRLKAAGLPPRKLQRTAARERRANEGAARDFFERRRAAAARKRLQEEYQPLDQSALEEWRQRSPLARRRSIDLARFKSRLQLAVHRIDVIQEETRMDSIAHQLRGRGPLDVDAELRQRVFEVAGGREFLAAGGDRHTAAMLLEETVEGLAAPAVAPTGAGMIWVPEHTRRGREIAGHWRRRPGG